MLLLLLLLLFVMVQRLVLDQCGSVFILRGDHVPPILCLECNSGPLRFCLFVGCLEVRVFVLTVFQVEANTGKRKKKVYDRNTIISR